MIKKKICVGMSGGVDSTTTAHLLLKQGHEVFGATMYLFDTLGENGEMSPPAFIEEARSICEHLGIDHYVVDLRDAFEELVKKPFREGFLSGTTPNPCTICNRYIKYGLFMDAVLALGADYMATGHYVNLEVDSHGKYHLKKGITDRKDQSYYLHGLSENRLSKLLLPLGQYETKSEIRAIAGEFHEEVAKKKDSLGICFTQGKTPFEYLRQDVPEGFGHGDFILQDGTVVGSHDGYYQFTIGQKKGLPQSLEVPLAVYEINAEQNQVILADESTLYKDRLFLKDLNWIHQPDQYPWKGVFKICTWGYDLNGVIKQTDNEGIWEVRFDEPVRAIARGQACVIYQDDEILGGGTIL